MAILFSQADGSDQHYDTYEEFEKAIILMKRLNGEKVPQDLLDEVKAKKGRSEPVQFEINGQVFEDLISSAAEPLGKDANGEDLYEGDYVTGTEANPYGITSPNAICEVESDSVVKLIQTTDEIYESRYEGESFNIAGLEHFVKLSDNLDEAKTKFAEINGDKEPKFEVGDKVEVVENKSGGHVVGTVGEISGVTYVEDEDRWSYVVRPIKSRHSLCNYHHKETDLNNVSDSTEFRTGDIVKVTETFEDSYGDVLYGGDLHRFGKLSSGRVCISAVFVDGDNIDKLQLVCRKEDRKDIGL